MKPCLILGIGNPLLCDDGIGHHLATALMPLVDERLFDVKTSCICSLELLDTMQGYKRMYILDGMRSIEKIPGRISFFTPDTYSNTLHLNNYHDFSLKDMLELATSLNIQVPVSIDILAIEIAEDKIFSESLSTPVSRMFDTLVESCYTYIYQNTEPPKRSHTVEAV